jgi:glycosyltransferase involved in cell wall biosynthesis
MQHIPRVTIVTPSFNQAPFLERTMQSVLGQDYPRIEYIIMDGGSTDGSVEIIRRYEHRLADWTSERDAGRADAINAGFGRATGSIFGWVNSDNLLAPSAVRIAVECFRRYPEAGVVYGDRLHIDALGNVIGVNRMPAYYPAMFRRNITLPQETVFFRREVFEKVGGLDASLRFALDFDLWVHMSRVTKFHHIPAFLGSYREHPLSLSAQADRYMAEHKLVYRRHFGRRLPGAVRMPLYRVLHKLRLLNERRSEDYRAQVRGLRELTEHPPAKVAWA